MTQAAHKLEAGELDSDSLRHSQDTIRDCLNTLTAFKQYCRDKSVLERFTIPAALQARVFPHEATLPGCSGDEGAAAAAGDHDSSSFSSDYDCSEYGDDCPGCGQEIEKDYHRLLYNFCDCDTTNKVITRDEAARDYAYIVRKKTKSSI